MVIQYTTILWSIGTESPFSPMPPSLLTLTHLFLISIPAVYFFYRLDDYDVDSLAKSVIVTVGITFFSVSILSPAFLFPWLGQIDPVYFQGYSLGIVSLLILTIFVVAPAFGRIRHSMNPNPILRKPKKGVRDRATSAVSRIGMERLLLFLIVTFPLRVMIYEFLPVIGVDQIHINFVGILTTGFLNWSTEPGTTMALFVWSFNPGYFLSFVLGWALPIAFVHYLLKFRRGVTTKKRLGIITLLSLLPSILISLLSLPHSILMSMSRIPTPFPVIVGLLHLRFSPRLIDKSPKEGHQKEEEEREVTIPLPYLIVSRIRETLRSGQ